MHIKKVIFVFCVCFKLLSCGTKLPSNAEGKICIKKQNNNYFLTPSSLSFTNCCCIFVKYPVYIFSVPVWKVYSRDIFSTWFHVLHETLVPFCTLTHWKIKKGKKCCQPAGLRSFEMHCPCAPYMGSLPCFVQTSWNSTNLPRYLNIQRQKKQCRRQNTHMEIHLEKN